MARHPLQRLESPSRGFSSLVHVLGILSFSASFRFMLTFPNPMYDAWGGAYQFLTIIGLTISMVTFVAGMLADVTLSRQLFGLKNVLAVCSAPLEVLISILYWGLSAINRDLVAPPGFKLPLLADIGFHAAPALALGVDLLLLSPPWTVRAYHAMGLSMALAFLYWGWVELCYSKNGWYPYPIFEMLPNWQRALLFTFSAILMTGSTMLLKWLYGQVNGVEEFKKDAVNPVKVD